MDAFDFKSYEYYQASLVDGELLKHTLPNCIRIIESEEDNANDLLTLEFDRKNCINIKNLLKYIRTGYFQIYHGQVFMLIEKIINLFEKQEYKLQQPRTDRIWLIFEGTSQSKFQYQYYQTLNYSLYYCWPLKLLDLNINVPALIQQQNCLNLLASTPQYSSMVLNKQIENNTQLKKIYTKLLKLCDTFDSQILIFATKPHKKFLDKINSNQDNFAQDIKQYVNDNQNINPETQKDLNIDSKLGKTQNEEDDDERAKTRKIQNKIKNIVNKWQNINYDCLWKKSFDILKAEHELQFELMSQGMSQVKIKDYRNFNFYSTKELFELDQVKELFQTIFKELNKNQTILKEDQLKYDNCRIDDEQLQILVEETLLVYFKQKGHLNSIKQCMIGRNYLSENPKAIGEVLKPKITEYYQLAFQLKILQIINSLI